MENMITICVLEKVESEFDYKYIIEKGAISWDAYRTKKGFERFLEIANINLDNCEKHDVSESYKHGRVESYLIYSEVLECYFWNIEEIPKGAKKFTGLSNGSYVECYYIHTDKGSKIFKPHPNAKEVYKPLIFDEYIKHIKMYG
ncbi:hypothetical protein BFS06_13720 [Clostridium perfringens]|uniref:Uncharacterized protein n=1 Tax=Clostridium perfringens TaxID=1502 RepID=A0A140GRS8_CLOPF|nr:hypothetical protein [Clostridium perfringens]AMN31237.1 hypothetical protein JFP838_pA0321 [Clostridium perfringens]TBX14263.1 hypothetical protein BFS06_13720 [Clostridium perfringens]